MATQTVSAADVARSIEAPDGVILPPPDIREIIEKTASYVHRNGVAFESRVRDNEQHNIKFSFLNPADPYHAYYEWRLDEYKAGKTPLSNIRGGNNAEGAEGTSHKIKGPPEPRPFEFSAKLPSASPQDIDIIRLTALFVAINGRQFMTTLAQKESRNHQFDFLRPTHSLYQYFTRLVEQYNKVIIPSNSMMKRLEENVADRTSVLRSAKLRADYARFRERENKKAAQQAEADKIAYAEIDWQDFVLVETIDFTEGDERTELPRPTSLAELQYASLEEQQEMSLSSDNKRIEEAPPTSETDIISTEATSKQQLPTGQVPPIDPSKIRPSGSTRLQHRKQPEEQKLTCPVCKQLVPASQYSEHSRIELLDPRWKEQRRIANERASTTNLSTQEVSANIKRLASSREDIFDSAGNAITPNELERQKRQALASAVQWDGYAASAETAKLQAAAKASDIDEQITRIHEKFRKQNAIGPGPKPPST